MHSPSLLGLLAAAGAVAATGSGPDCRTLQLSIAAAADNVHFTSLPDQNNATAIKEWLVAALTDPTGSYKNGTDRISGTYRVKATYCQPPPHVRPRRALQVLVHGLTYSKDLWAGLGFADQYNWHAYATRAGYHTLAVDRLGHGIPPTLSNLPNPFTEVQGPLQARYTLNLVKALRRGIPAAGLPPFPKIIYVGHSYGSWLGNNVARDDVRAVDAFVLTGYSGTVALPIALTIDFSSAAVVNPARFAGVPLGYLAGQTPAVRTAAFYAGAYDAALPARDFATHDTFAVGEGLSPAFTPLLTEYAGPVLLATGELDVLFCPGGAAACNATLHQTASYFPRARFSVLSPKDTGHTLSLHSSAPRTINAVHAWLDRYF